MFLAYAATMPHVAGVLLVSVSNIVLIEIESIFRKRSSRRVAEDKEKAPGRCVQGRYTMWPAEMNQA